MPDHVPLAEQAGQLSRLPEPAAPGPDGQHAWEAGELRWDAFYLLVFIAVLAIVLVSTPGSKAVAGTALALLIPWYLLVGRPLWTGGGAGRARAAIYVAGLFVLFGVAQSQNPEAWFLAFAVCPQFYSFLETRLAVALGIGLNFLAAALLVARDPSAGTAGAAFGIAAAAGGFSLFYGAWISRIIDQSAERAEIINQLEAARAELAAAQHEAGRLAERQRLAADIHDTLPDALRRLSQAPGLAASFALAGAPRPLPVPTEVVLLRVCQEALANVRKHACAQSAAVRLGYDPGGVRLEVSDDGAGFDPARVSGGYGLRGMRSRVTEAGGTLTVRSEPGAGTRVTAQVPA